MPKEFGGSAAMVGKTSAHSAIRQIGTLYSLGTLGALSDSQLLERFLAESGVDSEDAFALLVERHGTMVWGVCRRMLPSCHDAEDAFQAAFLVLARRARSIVKKGQLANWLYSVAARTASEVRRRDRRLRARERYAMEASRSQIDGPKNDSQSDLVELLDEELLRLPDRYRAAILLCELEGLSRREAARRLGVAEGTLSSRLARGRNILRERLLRRGVTLSTGPLAVLVREPIANAPPPALAASTVKIAVAGAATAGGAIPAAVATLARAVTRTMVLAKLKVTAMALALGLLGLATANAARFAEASKPALGNTSAFQDPAEKPAASPAAKNETKAPATDELSTHYAWRGRETYEPPDFDRFFPDDPAGGKTLDEFWNEENLPKRPAAEILRIVRQGLRRTTKNRDEIVGFVGSTYIWNAASQNPDPIEIIYHAADHRGPIGDFGDFSPVYYGLSVVRPKPPAVLRALVDLCMQTENRSNWRRIAWGAAAQRAELLSYLRPYLEAKDESTRDKANVLVKVLGEAPDQVEAVSAWIKRTIRAKSGHRLPSVKESLQKGSSRQRLEAIKLTLAEELCQIMDESFVEAFDACASDHDAAVLKELTRVLGVAQQGFAPEPAAKIVDLLLRLTEDANPEVRYYAVYQGLTPVPEQRRGLVVRRLITLALAEHTSNTGFDLLGRIAWGLQHERPAAIEVLDEFVRGDNPARAETARAVYKQLTGQYPPTVARSDPESRKGYVKAFHDVYYHLGQVYPNFVLRESTGQKSARSSCREWIAWRPRINSACWSLS